MKKDTKSLVESTMSVDTVVKTLIQESVLSSRIQNLKLTPAEQERLQRLKRDLVLIPDDIITNLAEEIAIEEGEESVTVERLMKELKTYISSPIMSIYGKHSACQNIIFDWVEYTCEETGFGVPERDLNLYPAMVSLFLDELEKQLPMFEREIPKVLAGKYQIKY